MQTINTTHYSIELNGDSVYFEHDTLGDESAANMKFEFRCLVDFSGVSVIPHEVSQALITAGYKL